eukprot:10212656-Lingulodinium_polyedra.AAC.1
MKVARQGDSAPQEQEEAENTALDKEDDMSGWTAEPILMYVARDDASVYYSPNDCSDTSHEDIPPEYT